MMLFKKCEKKRIFFVIIVGIISCKSDFKQVNQLLDKSILNTEHADGVTILYSKEGHTKAKLQATSFYHFQTTNPPYVEMKQGLRVQFYNDTMQVQSILTAKYGKYFEQNQNVLVRDSVVVVNNKQEQLQTEELIWNEKLQKFYTEKFVKITTPTQVIYGDGLEANQNFTEYTIHNIKGIISLKKEALD